MIDKHDKTSGEKALVLCGGLPQIALLQYLKSQGVTTVLADRNENVAGRAYADIFYPVSVLDTAAVTRVAVEEKVDFLMTVCADQVLQVVANVSKALGLPCYIDVTTAENVSKKSYMKRIFAENGIPTSKYVILDTYNEGAIEHLQFPLIVKPVDAYSSRGVRKVHDKNELQQAIAQAAEISRTHGVVVEEFVDGQELTVDVYVEDGTAHVLSISRLEKIGEEGKFVIHRGTYPAPISVNVEQTIAHLAQKIANAFGLNNAPMLIQLIENSGRVSVLEFCARTGGGIKFRLIENVSGFDVVKAVADLTMGRSVHYQAKPKKKTYINNEFLYCYSGTFDHLEGFEQLLQEGTIKEYYPLKAKGHIFTDIRSSGDRVACYTIEADTKEELEQKRVRANVLVKAIDVNGNDIVRHDLIVKG